MSWMTCNTCKTVVVANETGICLSCQAGFCQPGEDSYEYHQIKERIDAIEERLEQKDDKPKHQDGDEGWKATTPSRCNRPPNCS